MDDCLESPLVNKYSLRKRLKMPILMKALDIKGGDTVLDVGCGAGVFSQAMAKEAKEVIGLDYSETNIKAVKKRYGEISNLKFKLSDATNMPFDDECFDSILATELIEHIDDDSKFVEECGRVLKKGGRVVITTPCTNPTISVDWFRRWGAGIDITKDFGHKRGGYTKQGLFNILKRGGLEPDYIEYYDILFGEVAWVLTCMPRALTNKKWKSGEGQHELKDSFMFKLYKVIFPLFFYFSKLDYFLKGFRGHHILVVGKKV